MTETELPFTPKPGMEERIAHVSDERTCWACSTCDYVFKQRGKALEVEIKMHRCDLDILHIKVKTLESENRRLSIALTRDEALNMPHAAPEEYRRIAIAIWHRYAEAYQAMADLLHPLGQTALFGDTKDHYDKWRQTYRMMPIPFCEHCLGMVWEDAGDCTNDDCRKGRA